jgi:hypothetical protein
LEKVDIYQFYIFLGGRQLLSSLPDCKGVKRLNKRLNTESVVVDF